MIRQKIDYGIDLGTTNSAIARMDNGEPVVKNFSALCCIFFKKPQGTAYNSGWSTST